MNSLIIIDYEKSIEKIERIVKSYDDFDKARHEFYRLNNLYHDDGCKEFVNKIKYEINLLSFCIENGKLININQQDNNLNYFIKTLSDGCKNYLKERYQSSKNKLLKSLYSLILGHINSKNKINYLYSFIDLTIDVYHENISLKENTNSIFLSNCLLNAYVNSISKNHPKIDEIKKEIFNFIHDDFIVDIFSKINLIEFLFSKEDYKNFDISDMDDICWNLAKSCNQEFDSIYILKLGKKISNKLQNKKYEWDDEIGSYYEKLMLKEDNFLGKQEFCKKAIFYFKISKNQEKIFDLTKFLEKTQNELKLPYFTLLDIEPSFFIHVDLRLIKLINFNSLELIDYLIKSDENMPNLDYDDLTIYENVKKSSPIFMNSFWQFFDSNYNNRLSNRYANSEKDKAEIYYNFIHILFSQSYMKIYLNNIFEFAYVNNIFNYESFIGYLNKYSNLDNKILKFLSPAILSYFNQLDLYLSNYEANFVLFMDSIVSKIEFIIREICNKHGIITSDVYSNNISEKISLEKVFKNDDFKKILSNPDYHFLKIILTDEGINMRNELSHCLNFNKYSFSYANLLLFSFLRLIKYL